MVGSDDVAKLFLSDRLLIDYDALDKSTGLQTYLVPLEKGFYPILWNTCKNKEGTICGLIMDFQAPMQRLFHWNFCIATPSEKQNEKFNLYLYFN